MPYNSSENGLLSALREATSAAHERLHVHPAMKDLTEPCLTVPQVRHILARFYGFHEPLEKALANSTIPALADFQAPVATIWLERDLAHWGMDPAAVPKIDLPQASLSPEQAAGYLYLREGSTLGGQVIARHVRRQFELNDSADVCFFAGRGRETGASWKRFREALTTLDIDPQAAAGYSAHLFSQLDQWLYRV